MPRFVHRRAIVLLVLLCQVLAVSVVHVPMAQAAQSAPAAATSAHCHDGAPGAHEMSRTSVPASDVGHPGHHCKTGFCGCVCLNAPAALPVIAVVIAPMVSHPPLAVSPAVGVAPERTAAFFRPPI
ncbi:MAG TPA: CopL family metal-binding regulatory protein [Steroidobacteraceae bacterium]|jgi:hypothetical protein|nr:CopL family metal-binding regulatory protein [Steroidobacteraceae bacterium]